MRLLIRLLLCSCFVSLLPSLAHADAVTLAWDPPSGRAPAGYRVRYRPITTSTLQDRDAGQATSLRISALLPGTTYEFHVVAYDDAGLRSGPSNYLQVTIPATAPPPTAPDAPPPPPPPPPPPTTVTTPYFPGLAGIDPSRGQPYRAFLAEGANSTTFETRLALANPTASPAKATVYLRRDGEDQSHITSVTLPAYSHAEVDADTILGGQTGTFGIGVSASFPVGVSRTMTWNGGSGAHSELATATPAARWYFAEGATHGKFVLFYHLLNPGPALASVSITYLLPSGASLVRYHDVPAGARRTIFVNQEDPDLASTEVAAVVESLTGQPIVAERAMYLTGRGGYIGGHVTRGATELRSRWLLAEGATGTYFSTYLLLANPHDRTSAIEMRFRRADGSALAKRFKVPARSRTTVNIADVDPQLADTSVWTEVISQPDLPIVAERVMWWPGTNWQDGHAGVAAARTAARWLVVGGQHRGAQNHANYVVVANASGALQSARVTALGPNGSLGSVVIEVPPQGRHDVDMAARFPTVTGAYSVLVEAVGGAGQLVVEQSIYWDAGGQTWAAGTARPAQPLDD